MLTMTKKDYAYLESLRECETSSLKFYVNNYAIIKVDLYQIFSLIVEHDMLAIYTTTESLKRELLLWLDSTENCYCGGVDVPELDSEYQLIDKVLEQDIHIIDEDDEDESEVA